MSVRPFDKVVSPQEQQAWLNGDPQLRDDDPRAFDESLRQRHSETFEQFTTRPHAEDALLLLGLFLITLPFPRRTEQEFWLATCEGAGNRLSLRVTVHGQETFVVTGDEKGLEIHFGLAVSVLEEYLGRDWQRQFEADGYVVLQPQGDADQLQLVAYGSVDAEVLLRWLEPLMAMAVLNLRLMRQGETSQPDLHCPQLVDAAMALAEVAFEEFEEEEE